MRWTPSEEGNCSALRINVNNIWNPGNLLINYHSLTFVFVLFFKCFYFIDVFLFNAADQGSWNQWDTSSNLTPKLIYVYI